MTVDQMIYTNVAKQAWKTVRTEDEAEKWQYCGTALQFALPRHTSLMDNKNHSTYASRAERQVLFTASRSRRRVASLVAAIGQRGALDEKNGAPWASQIRADLSESAFPTTQSIAQSAPRKSKTSPRAR